MRNLSRAIYLKNPRYRTSPQATGIPHLRFYAGAPIILEDGVRVGSLCVFDVELPAHRNRFPSHGSDSLSVFTSSSEVVDLDAFAVAR
jgi:GAF domain-containing protein